MKLPTTKELVVEAEAGAGGLFKLWLRITRILDVQDKHARLIEAQAAQIEALRDAVHILQAREDVVLARAESAATLAASKANTELARRIGHIEARYEVDRQR